MVSHYQTQVGHFCPYKSITLDDKSAQNKALIEFYHTLSSAQLAVGMVGKKGYSINKNLPDLTPVVDGDFFPKSYEELRKEMPKKICMSGVTKNEGVFFSKSEQNQALDQ